MDSRTAERDHATPPTGPQASQAVRPQRSPVRWSILVSYALFVLSGLGTGVGGVLLVAQMGDYGVDRTVIGYTFFTGSAGFAVSSALAGPLIHRWGTRLVLLGGGGLSVLTSLYIATRPPLIALILIPLVSGFAVGIIESVTNAHLAALPNATTLVNRLHAFFGVGALIGPPLARWMVARTDWTMVSLLMALIAIPMVIAAWLTYPRRDGDALAGDAPSGAATVGEKSPDAAELPGAEKGSGAIALLPAALRNPAVLLGTALLCVYVGIELGVGNWAYAYLLDATAMTDLLAGYTVGGYWFGLTLGRFLISPVATRLGLTSVGIMYTSMGGVIAMTAVLWLAPVPAILVPGFLLLGFFLGPIFPTTMAAANNLAESRLMPTAIGIMNAGSTVGGAVMPWLAGAIAERIGPWTLLPIALVLGMLQLVLWWRMVARFRGPAPAADLVSGSAPPAPPPAHCTPPSIASDG